MTDELKITIDPSIVERLDGLYYVRVFKNDVWITQGRGYKHSTSAYAKLGRTLSKDIKKLMELKGE